MAPLHALTSSFCIDILGMQRNERLDGCSEEETASACAPHFLPFIFLLFVLVFKWVNDPSMIRCDPEGGCLYLWSFAGLVQLWYPYQKGGGGQAGADHLCVSAPVICFILDKFQKQIVRFF